jgi:type II secretory pathway component GspD/PulD (secretin)
MRRLQNANAQETAAVLQKLVDGVFQATPADRNDGPTLITFDERTNNVIVETEREYEDKIRELLDELDRPTAGDKERAQ